jgi:hypothetical protein
LGQRYTCVQVSQSSGQAFQLVFWGLETACISQGFLCAANVTSLRESTDSVTSVKQEIWRAWKQPGRCRERPPGRDRCRCPAAGRAERKRGLGSAGRGVVSSLGPPWPRESFGPLALWPAGESCFQAAATVTAKPFSMPLTVVAASSAGTQVPCLRPADGQTTEYVAGPGCQPMRPLGMRHSTKGRRQ